MKITQSVSIKLHLYVEKINTQEEPNTEWMSATGKLEYTLTNDYMFRAVLQKNQKVLKALICLRMRQNFIVRIK